ncbi:MAG: hypothetical protein EBR92_07055, partial [Alphaproteobacteria bacterium]|nr:hypothetical protein [Alphaproteobacteria bacterium]
MTAIAALPGGGVPTWSFGATLLVLTCAGRRRVACHTPSFAKRPVAGRFLVSFGAASRSVSWATTGPWAGWLAGLITPSGWLVTKIGTFMEYRRGGKGSLFGRALRFGLAWLTNLRI